MTWLEDQEILLADNFTKYNYAFYWSAMTMTTVGYGGKILNVFKPLDVVP
jgi:hypothetical protein